MSGFEPGWEEGGRGGGIGVWRDMCIVCSTVVVVVAVVLIFAVAVAVAMK